MDDNRLVNASTAAPAQSAVLQDSGDRREFGTGAVRDMAAGKGRYDLLPWHTGHEIA